MIGRVLLAAVLAGWLADRLARPDRDVEAGIEAYEAGELDVALERFDAAIARHGDRPELSLNRGLVLLAQGLAAAQAGEEERDAQDGLVDAARRAFERASESDDPEVRASAFYERGNVAFDAEAWDAAIEAYIECLKARPDHANAKWNLELARQRKEQQEKEQDDEQDDEEQDDDTGDDTGGSTGDDTGGSSGDDTGGGSSGDPGGSSGEDGGSTGQGGSSGDPGGTGDPDEQQDPPQDPQDPQDPQQDQPQPQPLDRMDIEKALEDLDAQDQFLLDRPQGGVRPPTEDW